MEYAPHEIFREYLESLPDELLESVTEDYVWLAGCIFHHDSPGAEFQRRRECCREECARRGRPNLFRFAEQSISPQAA